MDYDQFYHLWNNEIEPRLYDFIAWSTINALGIKPFKDGNQWCFLYGSNIQEGVCGFGDTIAQAASNFYDALLDSKIDIDAK